MQSDDEKPRLTREQFCEYFHKLKEKDPELLTKYRLSALARAQEDRGADFDDVDSEIDNLIREELGEDVLLSSFSFLLYDMFKQGCYWPDDRDFDFEGISAELDRRSQEVVDSVTKEIRRTAP